MKNKHVSFEIILKICAALMHLTDQMTDFIPHVCSCSLRSQSRHRYGYHDYGARAGIGIGTTATEPV